MCDNIYYKQYFPGISFIPISSAPNRFCKSTDHLPLSEISHPPEICDIHYIYELELTVYKSY